MEFVFRGKDREIHDLYVDPAKDGSVKIVIRAKNGTGESKFILSAEEFELLCKVRELSIIKKD